MRSWIYSLLCLFVLASFSTPPVRVYFVSVSGDDANPGTKTAPFASLEAAQKKARLYKLSNPGTSIEVRIAPGEYYLKASITFTNEDGGTAAAPVTYKAITSEAPVFTGGKQIKNWRLVKDAAVLSQIPPEAANKIYVATLVDAGITDWGDPTVSGKRPELFCNNQLQTLARWPNTGFARAGQVKGATALPSTYIKVNGTEEGIFEYSDLHLNRWTAEQDVRINGYFYWDWAEEFQRVDNIDTITHTITIAKPYHHYGYKDQFRYYALNLLSEIDSAGEWYLDRKAGLIYWYPPDGTDPQKATVVLSVFNQEFMVELQDCAYLNLEGIALRETRGSALRIKGGHHNQVKDCRIERIGRDGMHVEAGSNHLITGNYLSGMGFGGIKITAGDRKTLTPSGHIIKNNIIEYFSLFKRTYEPTIHFSGCGIHIAHNRLRHSSSSAMRLDGNEMLVEYNAVSHVVNESDDQGAIDMWYNPSYRGNIFRYNYWSDIAGGTRHGAAGIRLDDMISGTLIYGNVFERCGVLGFGAVQIHGGKENIVDNNIFFKCNAAVSFSNWDEKRWLSELELPRMKKILYEDVDINSATYLSKYPALKNLKTAIGVNTVKNNLIVDCNTAYIHINQQQQLKNNTVLPSADRSLAQYCKPDVLKQYGLQPVALQKMGLLQHRWVSLSR